MTTRRARAEYQLRLATPAFLGSSDQSGEWRTPPLKAFLRQWWRLVAAPGCEYDWQRIREREGYLFGHAWLEKDRAKARRSRVELQLEPWRSGSLQIWPRDPRVTHREVERANGKVGAHLYLGYGALNLKGRDTTLQRPPALDASDSATLRLRFPEQHAEELEKTLKLAHLLGTVGGRSRNGWGSIEIGKDGKDLAEIGEANAAEALASVSLPWQEALNDDWPRAIGRDDHGLLLWRTSPRGKWTEVMRDLAELKIEFRTSFAFRGGKPGRKGVTHPQPTPRHVLAFPVTNHQVEGWKPQNRLANQLRFKVSSSGGRPFGLVYHLPCRTPKSLRKAHERELAKLEPEVWSRVHELLDGKLQRIS